MYKTKTIRGKNGASVSVYSENGKFYLEGTTQKPPPRVYPYGVEHFPSQTLDRVELKGVPNVHDAEYHGQVLLKALEGITPAPPTTPPIPEPETPDWLNELASKGTTAK